MRSKYSMEYIKMKFNSFTSSANFGHKRNTHVFINNMRRGRFVWNWIHLHKFWSNVRQRYCNSILWANMDECVYIEEAASLLFICVFDAQVCSVLSYAAFQPFWPMFGHMCALDERPYGSWAIFRYVRTYVPNTQTHSHSMYECGRGVCVCVCWFLSSSIYLHMCTVTNDPSIRPCMCAVCPRTWVARHILHAGSAHSPRMLHATHT